MSRLYQRSILGQGYQIVSDVLTFGYKNLKPVDKQCYLICTKFAEMSLKNSYVDKDGIPFIWIGQETLSEILGVSAPTLIQSLKRLEEVLLIKIKRRGLTRTNRMYVYVIDINNKDFLEWKKLHRNKEITCQEVRETLNSGKIVPQEVQEALI